MDAGKRWAKRGVWLTLAAVLTIGCNPIQTIAFLTHKDQPIPADSPLRAKDAPKEDREKEVTVLVLTAQASGGSFEFAGMDRDLASQLAKRLPEQAKENKEKVTVVPQAQVDKFKMANPGWRSMRAPVIGKKLGADYVLDISIGNVKMFQPGSGNLIYEGRAEVTVDVYDVAAKTAEAKDNYVLPYMYPKTGMIAAGDVPPARFKMDFVRGMAVEITRKHIDHLPGDGIGSER